MSFAERHNKNVFDVPFDTKELPFIKCVELADGEHKVYGWFSTNGRYGRQYTLILRNVLLNLPKHMTDEMDSMTYEDAQAVKSGHVAVKRTDYIAQGRKCSSIRWVDI